MKLLPTYQIAGIKVLPTYQSLRWFGWTLILLILLDKQYQKCMALTPFNLNNRSASM